jgi:hypothetical protein
MSRTTRSAPNTFAVADDSGAVIGTITTSALGFIAWTTANKSLGGFGSMAGAIAAIESAARQ